MQTSTEQPTAPAQFPVLVSIDPEQNVTLTYYGEWPIQDAPLILFVDCPTNCLFVLDYETSQNGWIITGTTPVAPSAPLGIANGPMFQSLATIDPFAGQGQSVIVYTYSLQFANPLTGASITFDPQEVNVRN
nr:hypothetical protein [uncultured Duganella sp.]